LLEEFAKSISRKNITVTIQPRKIESNNPDFRVWNERQNIIGSIEVRACLGVHWHRTIFQKADNQLPCYIHSDFERERGGDIMKIRKDLIIVVLATFCLTFALFTILPTGSNYKASSIGEYDPWIDINDDGKIDMKDVRSVAISFGTTGDPTRNVNVTNWAVEQELFPENLVLRATSVYSQRMLLDDTTPYPVPDSWLRSEYDPVTVGLNTVNQLVYNQTFVYTKMSTRSYAISGLPQVSLSYNVTNSPSADFFVDIYVYLGTVSISGQWTQLLYLGGMLWHWTGAFSDNRNWLWAGSSFVSTMLIAANERLAIRVMAYGRTESGVTSLTYELLYRMNTSDFLVDIPIIKNP